MRVHQRGVDCAAAEDQRVEVATLAHIGAERQQRDAVGGMQSVAGRRHAREVGRLGQEEAFGPVTRHLARAGNGVAHQPQDVVVVENGDVGHGATAG